MANTPKNKHKKLIAIFLISFLVLAVILGIYNLPDNWDKLGLKQFIQGVENTSINWRFASKLLATGSSVVGQGVINRAEIPGIYKNIFISALDNESIAYFKSYPLDMKVWADMLNHYNSLEGNKIPTAVLMDIDFSEASPNPASHKALLEAFRQYKSLVGIDTMFYNIEGLKTAFAKGDYTSIPESDEKLIIQEGTDYNSPKVQALKRFELKVSQAIPVPTYTKVNPMISEIADQISFSGSLNMEGDGDIYWKKPMIIRMVYFLKENNQWKLTNAYYPSAILAMATKLLQSDQVTVSDQRITIRNATVNGKKQDFTIPVDANYRLAVDYRAPADSGFIRVLPLKDFNRIGLPRNAIILVGVTAIGTTLNSWVSPIGSMPSVHHLAFALGTIMNRDFIIAVPTWINILYVILLTILIGLLVLRGIRSTMVAMGMALIIPLALGFGLFHFRIQIITLIPLITSIMVLLFGEIYVLLTEEREKRFIKTTFSKYVNPDLVNILIQNPDMLQLGGQDKDATILFSDIRSFTTLSEGMTPSELITFLNIYLSRMTDIVMETSGTLDKYIGDAVVAFWGTPLELPNHALNGCKAAVKMMQSLKEFNAEQVQKGNKPINIGIGLNSGKITVGNIGSDKKKNYTAIGDNTTLAEDLQDENKTYHTNIIISEFTYNMVKDKVVARELDAIHTKGHEKPVRIYELLDILE